MIKVDAEGSKGELSFIGLTGSMEDDESTEKLVFLIISDLFLQNPMHYHQREFFPPRLPCPQHHPTFGDFLLRCCFCKAPERISRCNILRKMNKESYCPSKSSRAQQVESCQAEESNVNAHLHQTTIKSCVAVGRLRVDGDCG